MGFWQNLFGGGKRRCALCAATLHDGKATTGSMSMAQAAAMAEAMATKAIRCDACDIEFCMRCSVRAAKTRGINDYVCPRCGSRVAPELL